MADGSGRSEKRYPLAFALTVFLFAIWGGAHRIFGIVSQQFGQFFAFSSLQPIGFINLNLSYFLIALPVALFLRRFGYKLALVWGIVCFAVGALLFYPTVVHQQVTFQLVSVVFTGIGWAFLEISANALIVRMGPSATAIRRLNFAQCFYPVGLLVAGLFAQEFVLPQQTAEFGKFASAVVRPYVVGGLGALLFALIVESVEFPDVAYQRPPRDSRAIDDLKLLWHSAAFRYGLAALAIYSMGMASLWGSTARYARHVVDVPPAAGWVIFPMATWCLLAAGRVAGTLLMARIEPMRLFTGFAAAAASLCIFPAVTDSVFGLGCMLGASFFISILFPTILARTIKDLGPQTPMGTGMLVAGSGFGAISGIVIMRAIAGAESVHVNLAVSAVCFGLLLVYALKQKAAAAA